MISFNRFEVLENDTIVFSSISLDKCYTMYPTLATVDFGNKTARGLWIREVTQ